MLNQRILNYKITRKIGSGGMATVYEAVHTKLDTKVAIKILDPVLAANQGIRQRFIQEAKIMASLNHEGITKVIDFDEEDGHLAIIMEYLDGQTLDKYIDKRGALKEKEAIEIFKPILEAFAYAHKKNIVHRDVKPSNIFITTDGKVKIMDFGIAKIVEDGAKVLTQTGTQMGTPVYMSPEQVNDTKHIDQRTDIYSLGVTLWFMLAGKPPYDAETESTFGIFKKIDTKPLKIISQSSEHINSVIQKATIKEKQNRLANCNEFFTYLEVGTTLINDNVFNNEDTYTDLTNVENVVDQVDNDKKNINKSFKEKEIKDIVVKKDLDKPNTHKFPLLLSAKYGLFTGMLWIVYYFILYITGVDILMFPYLLPNYAILIIFMIFSIITVRKKKLNGTISYKNSFFSALITGISGAILWGAYDIIFNTFIDPIYLPSIAIDHADLFLPAVSDHVYDSVVDSLANPISRFARELIFNIIFSLVLSIILGLILKTRTNFKK